MLQQLTRQTNPSIMFNSPNEQPTMTVHKPKKEPLLKYGYSDEALESIQQTLKRREELEQRQIACVTSNEDRHSLLNSVLKFIPFAQVYDADIMSQCSKQTYDILEDEMLKMSMTFGRCLKSSIKVYVTISSKKTYFKKSDTYDTDGSIVADFRWIDEKVSFNVKYGKILDFRRNLLCPFSSIIEKFMIQDLTSHNEQTEDIWQFSF